MVTTSLLSTALMSLALILVAVASARRGTATSAGAARPGEEAHGDAFDAAASRFAAIARSPLVWTVTFVVVSVGVGVAAVVVGTEATVLDGNVDLLFYAVVAGALGLYICWGTYAGLRYRGLGNAPAVAGGIWTLGLLLILTVVVRLIVG